MKEVRKIIDKIEEKYSNFGYYKILIEKIENNVQQHPDISIESCKALIEGISKAILQKVDPAFDAVSVDKKDFQPLFKDAISKLSKYDEALEEDFINRVCSLIHLLGEIRNKRGDISHGKLAPKDITSQDSFSRLVLQITDAIVFYVLDVFFKADFRYLEEIGYDANEEFNNYLDDANYFEGISYSKALYEQDNDSYIMQLDEFKELKEGV